MSGKSRAEVTRKVKTLEAERDCGRATVPGRRPSLSTYLAEWVERRAVFGVRPSTAAGYRTDLGYVERSIGSTRVDRITASSIERLWTSMVEAGVVGSIPHLRRTLNAAMNDALRDGLIVRNPVSGVRVPKHTSPTISPFTIEELQQFLSAAATRRNAVRWTIAAVLGLRQGEALGLCWSDIDLDSENATLTVARQLQRRSWRHGCRAPSACRKRGADCPLRWGGGLVTSPPKSDAGHRTISLPTSIAQELVEHRRAQLAERLAARYWAEGDWTFTTPLGMPIDQRADWAEYKLILAAAGLRDARLHDLRHSSATLLLEAKTDMQTAGQILGHSSVAQTVRYTHVLADRRRAAAARIDTLMWGTTNNASRGAQ